MSFDDYLIEVVVGNPRRKEEKDFNDVYDDVFYENDLIFIKNKKRKLNNNKEEEREKDKGKCIENKEEKEKDDDDDDSLSPSLSPSSLSSHLRRRILQRKEEERRRRRRKKEKEEEEEEKKKKKKKKEEEEEEGQVIFKINPFILTSSSPVFRSILYHDGLEKKNKRILLPDKSPKEFRVLLNFLTPDLCFSQVITPENVGFLLRWTDEYQIKNLKTKCYNFLMFQPPSMDVAILADRYGYNNEKRDACVKHLVSKNQAINWDENKIGCSLQNAFLKEYQLYIKDMKKKMTKNILNLMIFDREIDKIRGCYTLKKKFNDLRNSILGFS